MKWSAASAALTWSAKRSGQRSGSLRTVGAPKSSSAVGQSAGEIGQQVSALPVGQSVLVALGARVVSGDGAQLASQLAVRDQRAHRLVRIQDEQAGEAGILGAVLPVPPPC
jgi:hypothetical protein